VTKKVRTFDLDPGTGRTNEPVLEKCPLFYLTSGEYALYSPEKTLLWRSDHVPPEASVLYSRLEKLRQSAEDIVKYDLGHDAIEPGLYVAIKYYGIDFGMIDPAILPDLYPEIRWLMEIADKQT